MILKGKSCSHAGNLGSYLLRKGDNEQTRFLGAEGTLSQDLKGAMQEMALISEGSRCENFLYHLSINPAPGEVLTPEQWERAVEIAEQAHHLEGHQRIIVEHIKEDRSHYHVVWNRLDPETMKAQRMSWDYVQHEKAARQMEKEFDLEHVQGRHVLEPGEEKAKRGPEHEQTQRAKRDGYKMAAWYKEIRAIEQEAGNGPELIAALEAKGYHVAQGRKVAFMILDPSGKPQRMAQSLGLDVKELRARLGVDPKTLPTVEQAQERAQKVADLNAAQEIARRKELEPLERAFKRAYIRSEGNADFQANLEREGFTLRRGEEAGALVAIDKEGRAFPLDGNTLASIRKLVSLEATQGNREKEAPAIDNGPSVRDRQREIKAEERDERKEGKAAHMGATLYDRAGMAQMQRDALKDNAQRQKLKEAQAKPTAAPVRIVEPPKESARDIERREHQEAKQRQAARVQQQEAAKEATARKEKTTQERAQQDKQIQERRADERKEQTKATTRPSAGAAKYAEIKARTEQTDAKQKGGSLAEALFSKRFTPSKSGREEEYERER